MALIFLLRTENLETFPMPKHDLTLSLDVHVVKGQLLLKV